MIWMIIQEREQTLIQRSLSSMCATATALGKNRYFCNVDNTHFNIRGRGFRYWNWSYCLYITQKWTWMLHTDRCGHRCTRAPKRFAPPSAEIDECLPAANSTAQGKARSPLQHRSCLKVAPLAPPPSTASHLWEHHALMQKLHSGSPEHRECSRNKCQRLCTELGNRQKPIERPLLAPWWFSFAAMLSARNRERQKAGDRGQSNWESSSLAVSVRVPEDRLPDQRSQAYGWQAVTLW